MKEIVFVTDSELADVAAIDFCCYAAKLSKSKLTALLLNSPSVELSLSNSTKHTHRKEKQSEAETEEIVDAVQAMLHFSKECQKRRVEASVKVVNDNPSEAVLYESRFADMMIIAADLSIEEDEIPSSFVKYILSKSECPVILAPKYFDHINEIVFCYDGSASSLFAMKQFTYLFPEYHGQKITVLEICHSVTAGADHKRLKTRKWLECHYEKVHFHFLEGDPKNELFTYFINKSHRFIVMGSYGRSMLSNFFRKSASTLLIKAIDLPLFIAHH